MEGIGEDEGYLWPALLDDETTLVLIHASEALEESIPRRHSVAKYHEAVIRVCSETHFVFRTGKAAELNWNHCYVDISIHPSMIDVR